MSDQDHIPDVVQLSGSMPQIVITEPSPLTLGANAKSVPAIAVDVATNGIATTPDVEAGSGVDEPLKHTFVVRDDQLKPALDCALSVEDSARDLAVVLSNEVPSGEREDNFRTGQIHECIYDSCRRRLSWFAESKYMLIVYTLLLAMPLSAGFMAARYMDGCPLSKATPIFLFMMGIAGLVTIFCNMLLIVQKNLLQPHTEWRLLKIIIVFGDLVIILLFCTELLTFLRMSPNFAPGSPNYCHEIFYFYTYWMNWTCLVVIVLLLFLHAPKCTVVNFQAQILP